MDLRFKYDFIFRFDEEKAQLINQINTLKTEINNETATIGYLNDEKYELKTLIYEKEAYISDLNKEIIYLTELTSARDIALDQQLARFEELESTITSLRNQITSLEEARDGQKAKINDKNREIEDAEAQMKALDDVS